MNRTICLTVTILMFSITLFNSPLTYTSFNKTLDGYSKSVVANSRTIQVPDNYTSIQEAIKNANEGDTIFVRNGTYYEHVKIDKSLTLVGENRSTTVIDGNKTGIVVYVMANNITLSGFTIQNGVLGIWFMRSNDNIITDNKVFSNKQVGIYSWWSSNNVLSGNVASNNQYGIYFSWSRNNAFTGNVATNNEYGIYLDGSGYNTLTGNNVSSNDNSGILLYHSDNNVLFGNVASNNEYGIYLSDSYNNVLFGNVASNNEYGIYLSDSYNNVLFGNVASNNEYGIYFYYSRNNILSGITAANNYYGVWLSSSSNNIIYHNNFIKNTIHARNIDSANFWDKGAEGNYWSGYGGDDANWDGIGDTPYPIYENNQDNYPLMATFSQFTIMIENQSYKIDTVSSSVISNLQCRYDPDNEINALSFKVSSAEGKGFCRLSIAYALIEPPYTVMVDQNSPLYFEIVYKNGTHTWLYFTYEAQEHEVTVMHTPYPEQLMLSQWAILGLSVIIVVLLLINVRYYRMFKEQRKVVQAYERDLGSFPVTHSERARLLFIKDVIEREEKIGKFKKKYGIKIQPAGTLEDLMEKLGIEKES